VIKRIIYSLVLTTLVSVVCSLFLLNFGFNFTYSLLFFILLQFVGFFFYGEYVRLRDNKLAVLAEIKALEEISKITAEVICPCDLRYTQNIPISLKAKNEYVCGGCKKKISVLIEPKTALMTEPMNGTLLDDPDFVKTIPGIEKE